MTVSQDNAQREVDRVSQRLRESEQARSQSSNHVSEQAIIVSQLQHQLMEAKSQLAFVGDGSEMKKEMARLKTSLDAKERQIKKGEEKNEMQKVEIANLTHKVKSLERGMKQMRDAHGFELPAAIASSVPSSITPQDANVPDTDHLIHIPTAPVPAPKAKRTSTRSKRKRQDDEMSARSSTDQESDLEMASLFMEEFDMGEVDDVAGVVAAVTAPKKKKSKRVVDEEDPAWMPRDPPSAPRKDATAIEATIPTRQSKRHPTTTNVPVAPTAPFIHNAVPESALMPPPPTPVMASSARSAKKTSAPLPATTTLVPKAVAASTFLPSLAALSAAPSVPQASESSMVGILATPTPASPTQSTLVSSIERPPVAAPTRDTHTFAMPSAIPAKSSRSSSKKKASHISYALQPVNLFWLPLSDPLEITTAISTTLGEICSLANVYPSDQAKLALATLSGRLCRVAPEVLASAVFSVLQQRASDSCLKMDQNSPMLPEDIERITATAHWDAPLLHLLRSVSSGSFIANANEFLDIVLHTLQTHLHANLSISDRIMAPLTRFYVSLCQNLNFVCRARFLVFDLFRAAKQTPVLSMIAITRVWPLVIEGRGCTSRGYISCTIEAILSQYLLNDDDSFNSKKILSEIIRKETGWKMELKETAVASKWAIVLATRLRRVLGLPQAPNNALSSNKILAAGYDLIRSLELILPHVDEGFGRNQLWESLLAPILSSLPQRSISEYSAKAISALHIQATLALAASTAIARAQHNAPDFVASVCHSLSSLLRSETPLPFSVQILVFDSVLETLAASSASHCRTHYTANLRAWLGSLPMIQRQHVPSHLERLLIPESC